MLNPVKQLAAALLPTVVATANDDDSRFQRETGGYTILFFLGLLIACFAVKLLCKRCDDNDSRQMTRRFRELYAERTARTARSAPETESTPEERQMTLINADATYGTIQQTLQPRSESLEP